MPTIDVPTLLTFWWRDAGTPGDETTFRADMHKAMTVIQMANAGNAHRVDDCNAAWRDVCRWQNDPATDDLLPLGLSHPTRTS